MPFQFAHTKIPGVVVVTPRRIGDDRGFFQEVYKASEFIANGITDTFAQDNHSRSSAGVLRGLHYQKNPRGQAKLVRVVSGTILDVAVDIRIGSPTYGKWVMEELSGDNGKMLYCPVGIAHGFYTVSNNAEVVYKVSAEYTPEAEAGLAWDCPEVAIDWPEGEKFFSDRDKKWPSLSAADHNFRYEDTEHWTAEVPA